MSVYSSGMLQHLVDSLQKWSKRDEALKTFAHHAIVNSPTYTVLEVSLVHGKLLKTKVPLPLSFDLHKYPLVCIVGKNTFVNDCLV